MVSKIISWNFFEDHSKTFLPRTFLPEERLKPYQRLPSPSDQPDPELTRSLPRILFLAPVRNSLTAQTTLYWHFDSLQHRRLKSRFFHHRVFTRSYHKFDHEVNTFSKLTKISTYFIHIQVKNVLVVSGQDGSIQIRLQERV